MHQTKIDKAVISNAKVRRHLVRESHLMFFNIHFAEYAKYELAPFQKEMIAISENEEIPLSIIVAFRGSGKSTIITTSYPIWAVLGKQQKKFVLIISKTQEQARQHFKNLKSELENNDLLKKDLGPFKEQSDEWGAYTLVLPEHNARISIASSEQSVRGLRHRQYRPDLIICDDIEDIQSTKTKDGREKTANWFGSEIIPLGDKNTKIIVVGNLLHGDSLLMKLKQQIESKDIHGLYKQYPIMDDLGRPLWIAKFPNKEAVEQELKKIPNEVYWQREYMLKIISEEGQVVHHEWIHYYDQEAEPRMMSEVYLTVDLAISEKDSADKTAILKTHVYGSGNNLKIYIQPNPINKKMPFPECRDVLINIGQALEASPISSRLIIENNGYQSAMLQTLEESGMWVEPFMCRIDKRSKLALTSDHIKSGKILFPRTGCEDLIQQITGFGRERYDDLADAFSMAILKIIEHRGREHGPTLIKFRGY